MKLTSLPTAPVKLIFSFLLSYPLAGLLKRVPDSKPWLKNLFIIWYDALGCFRQHKSTWVWTLTAAAPLFSILSASLTYGMAFAFSSSAPAASSASPSTSKAALTCPGSASCSSWDTCPSATSSAKRPIIPQSSTLLALRWCFS